MKRSLLLFCMLVCSLLSIAQERLNSTAIGVNGAYLTDYKQFGINLQSYVYLVNNFYIAPDISYYFPKIVEDELYGFPSPGASTLIKIDARVKALNYNLNVLYAYHFLNTKSFISPVVGLGGLTTWSNTEDSKDTISSFYAYVNLGAMGKFNVSENIYVSPQIKYMLPLEGGNNGTFVLMFGAGYSF